jgi:septal ring factor EnvC (AmiA/AmiB activator)
VRKSPLSAKRVGVLHFNNKRSKMYSTRIKKHNQEIEAIERLLIKIDVSNSNLDRVRHLLRKEISKIRNEIDDLHLMESISKM